MIYLQPETKTSPRQWCYLDLQKKQIDNNEKEANRQIDR